MVFFLFTGLHLQTINTLLQPSPLLSKGARNLATSGDATPVGGPHILFKFSITLVRIKMKMERCGVM